MNSFLRIYLGGVTYTAKVLAFNTVMVSSIQSVQTKRYLQHFPIKVEQPSLSLVLQTRGVREAQSLARLVRRHHEQALSGDPQPAIFSWPERGIDDWSGFILACDMGESVSDPFPHISLEVQLVDSMVSRRTWNSSTASPVEAIYQGEIPDLPSLDSNEYQKALDKLYSKELEVPSVAPGNTTPGGR